MNSMITCFLAATNGSIGCFASPNHIVGIPKHVSAGAVARRTALCALRRKTNGEYKKTISTVCLDEYVMLVYASTMEARQQQ